MKNNHPRYLAFRKKDRIKFQEEFQKLSTRTKSVLKNSQMNTWDGFYNQFLINKNKYDFIQNRNVGKKSFVEFLNFARSILNSDGQYSKELEKFESDFNLLSPRAKSALAKIGISLFETFYYRLVIEKEYIEFTTADGCGEIIRPEVEGFVESFCSYLGVRQPKKENTLYFNPKNPKIPFIADYNQINGFKSEFMYLSRITKSKLIKIGADNFDGFYTAFISPRSPFNAILNEFDELTLIELLRFRSQIKDFIKRKKDSAR